jgi:hypothetical protein
MRNVLSLAAPHLGLLAGAPLLLPRPDLAARWGALDDVVMGGVSESGLSLVQGVGEGGAAALVFRWEGDRCGGGKEEGGGRRTRGGRALLLGFGGAQGLGQEPIRQNPTAPHRAPPCPPPSPAHSLPTPGRAAPPQGRGQHGQQRRLCQRPLPQLGAAA